MRRPSPILPQVPPLILDSRRLLPPNHPKLSTKLGRCSLDPIHHCLAPWRCLQHFGRRPTRRAADNGTIATHDAHFSIQYTNPCNLRSFWLSTIQLPISSFLLNASITAGLPGTMPPRLLLRNRLTQSAKPTKEPGYCKRITQTIDTRITMRWIGPQDSPRRFLTFLKHLPGLQLCCKRFFGIP